MIWLTWRQFRLPALVVAAAVAALAVLLAATGPDLLNQYQSNKEDFLSQAGYEQINRFLYIAGVAVMYAAPPVIGAFWGAPLIARELETGTHRLVWNQSISRARWLAVKLGLTGLATIVITGLLSLAVTWWNDPIDDAINSGAESGIFNVPRLLPPIFGARGIVPIGYALFALALGVTVGLLVRRSVVAIAITLAAVALIQILSPFFLRPHLMTPVETNVIVTMENMRGLQLGGSPENPMAIRVEAKLDGNGNWKLSENTVNAAGQVQATLPSWFADCMPAPPEAPLAETKEQQRTSLAACFQRLADEGYRQLIAYQPASRFWALQWREAGVFFALAFALTGLCFWRIRRDLS